MRLSILAGLLACLLATTVEADPLEDGLAARGAKHYSEAMRILLPLANVGDDEAQRIIGEMIFSGQGVPTNPTAALAWTKLSADNGNKVAQYNLGYIYEAGAGAGAGAPRSIDLAVTWYTKSAQQNYVLAQRKLGELYASSNLSQSTYWFDQARLNGDEVSLQRYAAGAKVLNAEAEAHSKVLAEEQRARDLADRQEIERMKAEAAPQGNVFAAGIAEGLQKFQAESGRISDIHNQSMAAIEAQQAERRRMEREQAARQRAQDDRNRTLAEENRRAVVAAQSADQTRRAQAQAQTAAAAAQKADALVKETQGAASRQPIKQAAASTPKPDVAPKAPASPKPAGLLSANTGRSAMSCVTAVREGQNIAFTNNCSTKVFYVYCGELSASKQRCGDGPNNSFYTHSNNIPVGEKRFASGVVGEYRYAACEGGIAFGHREIKDHPDGSFECVNYNQPRAAVQ